MTDHTTDPTPTTPPPLSDDDLALVAEELTEIRERENGGDWLDPSATQALAAASTLLAEVRRLRVALGDLSPCELVEAAREWDALQGALEMATARIAELEAERDTARRDGAADALEAAARRYRQMEELAGTNTYAYPSEIAEGLEDLAAEARTIPTTTTTEETL